MTFSQVRSLTLDVKVWDSSVLTMFQSLGNLFANSVWEELLHSTSTSLTDDTLHGYVLQRLIGFIVLTFAYIHPTTQFIQGWYKQVISCKKAKTWWCYFTKGEIHSCKGNLMIIFSYFLLRKQYILFTLGGRGVK